ncbi:hypothetical protein ACIQF6_28450 [Kitasatospora sp. NPDC092948]|uniref:hypothetical protein n=1 Tax=Kitasatospora sp. NPDC092948 TaxID=3364088 RepID=UPI00380A389C
MSTPTMHPNPGERPPTRRTEPGSDAAQFEDPWIYTDTEFLPSDPRTTGLASIALVGRDDRMYYAVNAHLDLGAAHLDPRNKYFAEHVLPHLPLTDDGRRLDLSHPDVKTPGQIRSDVAEFLARAAEHGKPRLAAWQGAQDLGRIHELWGNDWSAFPPGMPCTLDDLEREAFRFGLNQYLPPHRGRQHHALDDALWDRAVHDMLTGAAPTTTPLWDRPVGDEVLHHRLARVLQQLADIGRTTCAGHITAGVPVTDTARLRDLADQAHGLAVRLDGTLPTHYLHRTIRADVPHDPYMEQVDRALDAVDLRPVRWWSQPTGDGLDGGMWLDSNDTPSWPEQIRLVWTPDTGWTVTHGAIERTTHPLGIPAFAAAEHVAAAVRAFVDRRQLPDSSNAPIAVGVEDAVRAWAHR